MAFNHEGNYICECGRIFTSSQAFNGHKSSCKIHNQMKYGNSDFLYERYKLAGLKGSKTRSEKLKVQREQDLQKWVLAEHKCETCNKIMTKKYGSGRFCCRACANSRKHSDETKQKISVTLKSNIEYTQDDKGNLITMHQKHLLDERQLKASQRLHNRGQLARQIDLANSPYNEFDTAYLKIDEDRSYYQLTKHDSNNTIIKRTCIPVYRYLLEYHLKRKLTVDEVVHHKDGDSTNNDLANLEIMLRSEHSSLHSKLKSYNWGE